MASSTFYYHTRPRGGDRWESARAEVASVYHENRGRYGYRRITAEMRRRGRVINHKTVRRLMSEAGLKCEVRMRRYRSYRGEAGKTAPNVIARDFRADRPLRKLATDVTEFSILGVKRYLSPVLDMYNGEILHYTLRDRPILGMVTDMLEGLFSRHPDLAGAVLHSDQGWQYRHGTYQGMLAAGGVTQSMSRKGNCLDNAVMENFFGLLKSELLYLRGFDSVEEFDRELRLYIEYYNGRRIKERLGWMSPVQYRLAMCRGGDHPGHRRRNKPSPAATRRRSGRLGLKAVLPALVARRPGRHFAYTEQIRIFGSQFTNGE